MYHILQHRCGGRGDGVGIRSVVEIERTTQEIMHTISDIELRRRSGIAFHFVENAIDAGGVVAIIALLDGIGTHGVFVC